MNKRRKIKLSFLFGIVFFKDPEGVLKKDDSK